MEPLSALFGLLADSAFSSIRDRINGRSFRKAVTRELEAQGVDTSDFDIGLALSRFLSNEEQQDLSAEQSDSLAVAIMSVVREQADPEIVTLLDQANLNNDALIGVEVALSIVSHEVAGMRKEVAEILRILESANEEDDEEDDEEAATTIRLASVLASVFEPFNAAMVAGSKESEISDFTLRSLRRHGKNLCTSIDRLAELGLRDEVMGDRPYASILFDGFRQGLDDALGGGGPEAWLKQNVVFGIIRTTRIVSQSKHLTPEFRELLRSMYSDEKVEMSWTYAS